METRKREKDIQNMRQSEGERIKGRLGERKRRNEQVACFVVGSLRLRDPILSHSLFDMSFDPLITWYMNNDS